jgi:hypothetical protein
VQGTGSLNKCKMLEAVSVCYHIIAGFLYTFAFASAAHSISVVASALCNGVAGNGRCVRVERARQALLLSVAHSVRVVVFWARCNQTKQNSAICSPSKLSSIPLQVGVGSDHCLLFKHCDSELPHNT